MISKLFPAERANVVIFFLCLLFTVSTFAQSKTQITSEREKAYQLVKQNRFLDALPFLEKIAATNPIDGDFWAFYSFALYTRSQTLETSEARQKARLATLSAAHKAEKLGSKHPLMFEILATIPEGGGVDKFAENPQVNAALQEGEAFFGRGEYEKAFAAYQLAMKLDPENYEAVVFSGDTFFSRKMYPESEFWFAKAVKMAPDRELAYRFWGDALMLQGKPKDARDKYIEALIVAPFSRLSWENLTRWAEQNGGWSPTPIAPPGGKPFGDISFDETLLKAEDGTVNWLRYRQMREAWQKQIFKKEFPNADKYRQTLREEAAALQIVAETSKTDLQKGKVKKLDDGLANLIKINDAGLLEAYVLFVRPNNEISEDYDQYRTANRDKLRRFIIEFLIGA